ncbi:MAG: LysR family transcriptional regulator [Parvibaculaceae bacterium]|jgi:DNA-binding transcriptional LysR family regulator
MDPHLDVRDFRFFLAIGEELHFRRAAERLRLAQPHLSHHIKDLESRLGVRLLDRTTRSVKLTRAGAEFLERSKYMLAQIDQMAAAARRIAQGHSGELRIGFTDAAARNVLPSVLRILRKNHPNIDIILFCEGTALQVQKLIEGQLHFGFLRLPVHTRRLRTLSLGREGLVAALPRNHGLASKGKIRLENLAKEDFIQYSPILGVDFQEHILSYCQRAGFTPRVTCEVDNTHTVVALVSAGFGVAIVPEYLKYYATPNIVFKPLSEIPRVVDIGIAWLPGDPSPICQAFHQTISGFLKKETRNHRS